MIPVLNWLDAYWWLPALLTFLWVLYWAGKLAAAVALEAGALAVQLIEAGARVRVAQAGTALPAPGPCGQRTARRETGSGQLRRNVNQDRGAR